MSKRNYTHIQMLLPEIEAMIVSGKTQREVAEHFGLKDKYVVKRLLKRQREKQRKLETGIVPRPKGRSRKDTRRKNMELSRHMRLNGYEWKTNCCGIFCNLWEGSENKGKMPYHLSSWSGASSIRHVPVL